ncbi:MAG TPA: hypothetical protein VHK25_12000, partial [Acidimicrobiales bacterium]|nr:hypothetical protein [Acidimicrobiales bacterium]
MTVADESPESRETLETPEPTPAGLRRVSRRRRRAERRSREAAEAAWSVTGVARVDRRTKRLVKRLRPGDVAVIDHADLDRVAAETLVDAAPSAVVNASQSVTGRYPNVGPLLLCRAGIPLVDDAGDDVL